MLPTVSAEERWEERRAERGSPLRQHGGMIMRDLQIWRHEQSFRELISFVQILFGQRLGLADRDLHAAHEPSPPRRDGSETPLTRIFSSRTMVGGAAEPRLQAVHRDRCTG